MTTTTSPLPDRAYEEIVLLRRRIEDLEARNAILELGSRYARGVDRLDRDLLRSCFHPDSEHRHGRFEGLSWDFCDEIIKMVGSLEHTQHLLGTRSVVVDGDTASAELCWTAYHKVGDAGWFAWPWAEPGDVLIIGGRYLDRYERREGGMADLLPTRHARVGDLQPPAPPPRRGVPRGADGPARSDGPRLSLAPARSRRRRLTAPGMPAHHLHEKENAMDDDTLLRRRLRLGVFMPPWTIPVDRDPTLFIRENIELVEYLDSIGYDEAWMGEHHSSGYQIIGSPELFVAAAIERTRRIRIGTGVISLPYHNPYMVADRIVQLDHQAQGRAMFGFGQGLTPSDMAMLGIDTTRKREQSDASLEVVLRLLDGETVTAETDWFTLYDATLQLNPYSRPRPDLVIASAVSTSGGENAGRFGIGMLCVAAGAPGARRAGQQLAVANEQAALNGHTMDRSTLRLAAPIHLAPSRDQAIAEVEAGFEAWKEFIERTWAGGAEEIGKGSLESIIENGTGVIGTADDALAFLDRLWKKSGGFGCLLNQITNWAPIGPTRNSLQILADKVLPEFAGRNTRRLASP